jgi:uncharacterized repeat protein (TIGR01451 family)
LPSNFGTNYFDVVVTTPYGLSVTSAVVTVGVDTTPQAPVFQQQPANLLLYAGQNAIFTATVISPGNPTFTWYSNNVIVTAGVGSPSLYTSTMEIDNITNSNAATYRVAVTNDVYPTGIVSTNATLAVRTPAQVTIGYLHTLVDPTSFAPTNVPPTLAYQVTGTVTTYTNLTSGTTSSYYLQDATGGINIFVSGDSSFRPQLGDVVTFVGVLSTFSSGLELYADGGSPSAYPFTSYTVLSNNIAGLPAPRPIAFNFLSNKSFANTNLGGLLVQISDVYFGTNAGTVTSTTANQTTTITNSAGQVFNLYFPDLDLDVAGQTLPTYAYAVNGVVYSLGGIVTNTIVVTRFSDILTNPFLSDVGVTLTGPSYVFAGSNVLYTISITNNGPQTANGIMVTDGVPAGATFVSASGGGVNTSGKVTWSVGSLAFNGVSNVTLTVKAPASGSLGDSASAGVAIPSADTNLVNNVSPLTTSIAPIPVAGPIARTGGSATISWNAVAGPTYSVLWSTNVAGPYTSIASGLTSSPYTDSGHPTQAIGFYKITSP